MELRKILLRVLLGSLAIAALGGVLAMLFFRESIVGRLIGTTLMTAAAAGLMIALSFLADRDWGRPAALVGMAMVVGEVLLGLLGIWVLDVISIPSRVQAMAGIPMFAIGGEFVPVLFFLVLATIPRARFAGWAGVVVCTLVFLLFIIPTCSDKTWAGYERWAGTAGCVAAFGVVLAASLAGAGFDRRHWRYIATAAAILAAVMVIAGIWLDIEDHSQGPFGFTVLLAVIGGVAVFVAHMNLVLLCPLKPGQRWVGLAALSASAVTAILIVLVVAFEKNDSDGPFVRLAGATGILAACGSLALLILAALNRKPVQKLVLAPISHYTLICPGCNQRHLLPVGDAQCPSCLLGIHVSFEEPHCPKCNYLLYMLEADRCPECGEVVRNGKLLPPNMIAEPDTAAATGM